VRLDFIPIFLCESELYSPMSALSFLQERSAVNHNMSILILFLQILADRCMSMLIIMNTPTAGEEKNTKRADSKKRSRTPHPYNNEKTKERILATALQLFRTKGAEETTAHDISTRAKVNPSTVLNYFPEKEDLAAYFFQKELDDLIGWFSANARLQNAPLREQLLAIFNRQLEAIAPYEDFARSVFFRSFRPGSKLNALSLNSRLYRVKCLCFMNDLLKDAARRKEILPLGPLGAYGFAWFWSRILNLWLMDTSPDKQKTHAVLDHSIKLTSYFLGKNTWSWT